MSPATDRASFARRLSWTTVVPIVALVVLGATWGRHLAPALNVVVALVLAAAVLAAVHHAEVVAHRVGEPFGSLVLAVAVTVIEVALIVTLMISGADDTATLARDTVFAAVMITCNGIVGLSLFLGARRYGMAVFNAEGSGAALATVATVATLSLVLPTFTTSRAGPAVLGIAAGLRRGRLAGAVRGLRDHSDGPPPGLLPARPHAGHGRPRRGARRTADQPRGVASACSCCWWHWWRWSGWRRSSHRHRGQRRGVRLSAVVRRRRHRPARPAARDDRRVTGGPARQSADQPEPGLRLGSGEHRPDHPGRSRSPPSGWTVRCCWGSGPRRWCCWRSPSSSGRSPWSPVGRRVCRAACIWCCWPASCSWPSTPEVARCPGSGARYPRRGLEAPPIAVFGASRVEGVCSLARSRGCSSMVEPQPSKLAMPVRSRSPAPHPGRLLCRTSQLSEASSDPLPQ